MFLLKLWEIGKYIECLISYTYISEKVREALSIFIILKTWNILLMNKISYSFLIKIIEYFSVFVKNNKFNFALGI